MYAGCGFFICFQPTGPPGLSAENSGSASRFERPGLNTPLDAECAVGHDNEAAGVSLEAAHASR